jgi:nitrogen PTS system EIIA component
MRIAEFLKFESVNADLLVGDKNSVLRALAESCGKSIPQLSVDRMFSVFQEREKIGSTGMEKGVAIPHGRLGEISSLVACFARSKTGVPFEARDGLPSHFFFALLAPENSAGLHLKALSKISRLFRSDAFREALLSAETSKDIYELICTEDARA